MKSLERMFSPPEEVGHRAIVVVKCARDRAAAAADVQHEGYAGVLQARPYAVEVGMRRRLFARR